MLNDPELVGEWRDGADRFVFDDDGYYLIGRVNQTFQMSADGMTARFWNEDHQRVTGDPSSHIGIWRTTTVPEEIYLRGDGNYVGWFNGEPLGSFGTYTLNAGQMEYLEYRARYETQGNQLFYYSFGGVVAWRSRYRVSGNTLTITSDDGVQTLIRWPGSHGEVADTPPAS